MRVAKSGDAINGYSILAHLNTGAMANAYAARTSAGTKVFLKQYKSPSVRINWFWDYVKYQQVLKQRVLQPKLARFCVQPLDSFVFKHGPETFFQVYEFVEGGHDLEKILVQLRRNPEALTWDQRTILARVMMAGVNQLHEHKIAHCDLKPANLQMLKDPSITAGYQLKLIDMDFSVLTDSTAPWHGHEGYVGTPRYFSPEHLRREIPGCPSDVFTCGIILYELLGKGHPYVADDEPTYAKLVNEHKCAPPALIGQLGTADGTERLAEVIHRCLSPSAAERPTAREINFALNGKFTDPVPTAGYGGKVVRGRLELVGKNGRRFAANITTRMGRHALQTVSEEAKRYADDWQFTLDKRGDAWWLIPNGEAANRTLINGREASAEIKLASGDRIEIGSRTNTKTVLPLTVIL